MIQPVKKERNTKLDLLRFSGVLVIMIAHSDPPGWLFQLRNFGSPMLILGSALTYAYIYKNRVLDRVPFFKKRLKRLILPAWIFLTFFFALVFIAFLVLGRSFPYTGLEVFESYTFYDGIGFVWIFKVYMILALITPIGLQWSKSSTSNRTYFSLILLVYLMYELAVYLHFENIPVNWREFVSNVFLVVIPYSALYFYGLRLHSLSNRQLLFVIFASLAMFSAMAFQKFIDFGAFVPTQAFKRPPTLYYLSYAFFCINLFYYSVVNYLKLKGTRFNTVVVWLSANSLWIYLWHILAFLIWGYTVEEAVAGRIPVLVNFVIKCVFLLSFGVAVTYLQTRLVNRILAKDNPPSVREFLSFLR